MIAIPLTALNLADTKTSKLFGKAPYVLLISPDGSAGILQNTFTSGRELAAELIRRGVKTVITNHLGQKAYTMLNESNIEMLHHKDSSSVRLVLDAYKAGNLNAFDASMIQEEKHRNEGMCNDKHGEGACCEHEHDGEQGHEHGGGRCCENGGTEKKKEEKRCCHRG